MYLHENYQAKKNIFMWSKIAPALCISIEIVEVAFFCKGTRNI
jgi:hypothetical protein